VQKSAEAMDRYDVSRRDKGDRARDDVGSSSFYTKSYPMCHPSNIIVKYKLNEVNGFVPNTNGICKFFVRMALQFYKLKAPV